MLNLKKLKPNKIIFLPLTLLLVVLSSLVLESLFKSIQPAEAAVRCKNRYDVNCDGRNDLNDFYALVNYLESKGIHPPVITPVPTATPTPTTTVSPTPMPSMTMTPTPTTTQVTDSTLCPDHNPNAWHALYDPVRKCHYDHEHGDNPTLGDAIFGSVNYANGDKISYAWATSAAENTHKHGGYKYAVRTPSYNPLPDCHDWVNTYGSNPNCVVAARIQFHIVAATMDSMARYHSYYEELKICKGPEYTQCGIVKIGGWADFGELRSPYPGPRVVRPGGTIDFGDGMVMTFKPDAEWGDLPAQSGEPYVAVENTTHDNTQQYLENNCKYVKNCDYMQGVWSMNDLDSEPHPAGDPAHNQYIRFLIRTFDDWNLLKVDNPNDLFYFCKDGSCEMNGSVRALNEVNARIPSSWDPDGDGFVTVSGFTDRWGNPKPTGCTEANLDCVPYSLSHVPVGIASTEDPGNGRDVRIEYDTSPAGKHWIRFPN